jgi:prepilin-type N-terminal cleavage/methylation domain-containing protein
MKISETVNNACGLRQAGFTMIEVTFAAAIAALVLAGMFQGYNMAGMQAQFSACNLAANSQAMKQLEQADSASWVPSYNNNELLTMSGTNTGNLCLPSVNGNLINCTNYTTVTQISTTPPYAMIQVQCVWSFPSYGGMFTNTVAVLRAPNI